MENREGESLLRRNSAWLVWAWVFLSVFIWSAIEPKDYFTWFLEVLPAVVGALVLAFSAFYELIEWWVAVSSGDGAEAFLGTQSYIWDTQSDMFMALIGGVVGLLVLSRAHDLQLRRLP